MPVSESLSEPVQVPAPLETLRKNSEIKNFIEESESLNCSICQDSINNNDIIRCIKLCNHKFHINCIDKWFEKNTKCPICRIDIRDQVDVINSNSDLSRNNQIGSPGINTDGSPGINTETYSSISNDDGLSHQNHSDAPNIE